MDFLHIIAYTSLGLGLIGISLFLLVAHQQQKTIRDLREKVRWLSREREQLVKYAHEAGRLNRNLQRELNERNK